MDKSIIVDRLSMDFFVNSGKKNITETIYSLFKKEDKQSLPYHGKQSLAGYAGKKRIKALKEISFTIQKGELVGFIGPNGAGKTTTMKVLSGLLYPTSGFVSVLDHNPFDKSREFLKDISVIFGQKNQLWWDLPVINSFEFNKAIYEIKDKTYEKNLNELVELLDVGDFLNTQVRKLSLGQRMKMELIASLLHSPKVLFLDEPTLGLDLVAQQNLRDFIYEYNKKNEATILLTSHNMNDLVDLCRRIIIISDGQIMFDGPFDEIVSKFAKEKTIKITLSTEVNTKDFEEIGHVKKYTHPYLTLSVPRSTVAFAAAEILQKFSVVDLNIEETPIEDVIRTIFKSEKSVS